MKKIQHASSKNEKVGTKASVLFLYIVFLLSFPAFITGLGLVLRFIPVGVFLLIVGVIGWPRIIVSSNVSFVFFLLLHPLLVLSSLVLLWRNQFQNKKKMALTVYFVLACIGFVLQFGFYDKYDRHFLTNEYVGALSSRTDIKHTLVTKPIGIERMRKNMLWSQDINTSDFSYTIVGWRHDNELLYKREETLYSFDITSGITKKLRHIPEDVFVKTCDLKECYPKLANTLVLNNTGYLSPDGTKIAIRTWHMYGPHDVEVVYGE